MRARKHHNDITSHMRTANDMFVIIYSFCCQYAYLHAFLDIQVLQDEHFLFIQMQQFTACKILAAGIALIPQYKLVRQWTVWKKEKSLRNRTAACSSFGSLNTALQNTESSKWLQCYTFFYAMALSIRNLDTQNLEMLQISLKQILTVVFVKFLVMTCSNMYFL